MPLTKHNPELDALPPLRRRLYTPEQLRNGQTVPAVTEAKGFDNRSRDAKCFLDDGEG